MNLMFYQMISMSDDKQYFVWKNEPGYNLITLICVEMDINIWESPIERNMVYSNNIGKLKYSFVP